MLTYDEIIAEAKAAGAVCDITHATVTAGDGIVFAPEELLAFGRAIAEKAAKVEREADAKVCEEMGPELIRWWGDGQANAAAQECAAAIRKRGEPAPKPRPEGFFDCTFNPHTHPSGFLVVGESKEDEMIYPNEDRTQFCISSGGTWLPGVYEDERTARYAFRPPESQLQQLQDEANSRAGGSGGVITWGDIARKRGEPKA